MDPGEFWRLAGRRDVLERLAARPPSDITDFADHLARALYELGRPELFEQVGSDDAFLYARCAVIVAGRRAYERVLRKPAAFERYADRDEELLLTVAEEAYERATGMLWEHETPVSCETGSNAAAWGGVPGTDVPAGGPGDAEGPEPAHPQAAHVLPAHPPPAHPQSARGWLELSIGWGGQNAGEEWRRLGVLSVGFAGRWTEAYSALLDHVVEAVNADPAWAEWWAAGVPRCELSLLFDGMETPGLTVRKGRRRIAVDVVRELPDLAATEDPAELLPRAADEVLGMLGEVGVRLGLAELPPFRLPAVPDDLPGEDEPVDDLPLRILELSLRNGGVTQEDLDELLRDQRWSARVRRRGAGPAGSLSPAAAPGLGCGPMAQHGEQAEQEHGHRRARRHDHHRQDDDADHVEAPVDGHQGAGVANT